ncbi:MAG: carboxypeptidase-like regulatory domain-containing protein [Candidatus Marinimicrobia bacterium]|nr:carboxypeptidase-like regulatory domain-containing protein [Candidatus Neomarinimicrobiota bacterium]
MKRFFIFLFLISHVTQGLADDVRRGRVVDKETGLPLPGVNIFFAGTTIGTISDDAGNYIIRYPENLHTNLIFQHIGYKILEKGLKKATNTFLIIELAPKSVELKPVYVSAERSWLQNYQRQLMLQKFLDKFFLNKTISDQFCEIENTQYLDFNYHKPEYEVTCDTLLIVKNNFLGYQMKVALNEFHWVSHENHFNLKWEYFINFNEMSTQDSHESKYWKENRVYVYQGSFRHFIKTVINQDPSDKNFKIFKCKKVRKGPNNQFKRSFDTEFSLNTNFKLQKSDYNSLNFSEVFSVSRQNNLYRIDYNLHDEYLIIEYRNRIKGFIQLLTNQILSDDNGNLLMRNDLMVGGDWQNYGMESQLPLDYVPDN